MRLRDVLPTITTTNDAVIVEHFGRSRSCAWEDVRSAEIGRCLRLHTRTSAFDVSRRSRGYLLLVDELVERRLLRVPEQLAWTTTRLALTVFAIGVGLIAWGTTCEPLGVIGGAFIGVVVVALSPFCWERYVVRDREINRWSVFGFKRYTGATLLGSELREGGTLTGLPDLLVTAGSGCCFAPGARQPVLVALILKQPYEPLHRHLRLYGTSRPRSEHLWVFWVFFALPITIGVHLVPASPDEHYLQWGFTAFWLVFGLLLTRGRLLTQFRADGLKRVRMLGTRFEPASTFAMIRGRTLVRHDGTVFHVEHLPVDWILRHWMPNPVAPERDGYRTMSRGANKRSVESYAFEL